MAQTVSTLQPVYDPGDGKQTFGQWLDHFGKDLRGKCEDCILGHQTRRPFDDETMKKLDPLELVSFDLWGPSRVQSMGGKTYFMPIIDAGTSFKHGAYLADKSDISTIAAFDVFHAKAESMTGCKIRRLRTDHAYGSSAWDEYCRRHNILHKFTAPYSSAQNGLAECAIRTTMEDVRTLLRDAGLGHSFWAEAAAAFSVDARNVIVSHQHPGRIPLESFTGKRQNISHLRVFGSKCWSKIPTVHGVQVSGGSKLDNRGVECILLGFASSSGNYKVQDVTSHRVFVSCDIVFEEGYPHRTSPAVGETIQLFDTLDDENTCSVGNNGDNGESADNSDFPLPDVDSTNDNEAPEGIPTPTLQLPTLRRSTRVPLPSTAVIESEDYQKREVASRREGHDWATNRPRATLAVNDLNALTIKLGDYTTCLAETKASHHIPVSYRHAIYSDPQMVVDPDAS